MKEAAALLMRSELLPGEKLLRSFGANALLPLYPGAGSAPYVLGASSARKVLGMLHLTNYRLKFKPADPTEADFAIFLPAIAGASDVSRFFVRKFRLTMRDETFIEFLRWGIPSFLASLKAVQSRSRELDWVAIRRDIAAAAPDAPGSWSVLPGQSETG
jgi:hypothetical protein